MNEKIEKLRKLIEPASNKTEVDNDFLGFSRIFKICKYFIMQLL